MKSKKWVSPKSQGNITESIVEDWFKLSGFKYKRENTIQNTRIRSKGSVDFTSDIFAIEVKKFTKLLTFKLGSNIHDLHWEQIEYLNKERLKGKVAAILITEDNKEFFFIRIEYFLAWYSNTTRKSINADIARKIGYIVYNEKDLKRVLEMEV